MAKPKRQEPETEAAPLPNVEWLTLVRVDEGDYRVLRLVTEGVPLDAEIGEDSASPEEAEERFKVQASLLFDRIASAILPERAAPDPAPNPIADAAAHNRAIDAAITALTGLRKVAP